MAIEMKIKGLMIDPVSKMPIIILKNLDGKTVLPIWVGIFEANAIAMQLEEVISPRPMTHDLLKSIIEGLRAEVDQVVITDLKDNTFFASIHLLKDGERFLIDARPSDAMALALRAAAPIQVESQVIDKSEGSGEESEASDHAERLRKWLENIDPDELGQYEM